MLKRNARTLKRNARVAVAAAVLAAGGVLAHLHVASQVYYPVLEMSSPDGLRFTAVQDESAERRKCGEANDRFIEPVRAGCAKCEVVYARCERELDGLGLQLMREGRVPYHMVRSPGLRLAIDGPEELARRSCEFIAADLVKRGYRSAVCLRPAAR